MTRRARTLATGGPLAPVLLLLLIVASPGSALAQPGAAFGSPQLRLSPEDYRLLQKGEVSTGRYITGGIIGSAYGLGIGHAIHGRWKEKGYIFSVTQPVAMLALIVGFADCIHVEPGDDCHTELLLGGLISYTALRIWEIVDVWAVVPRQNRRVRELRLRQRPLRYSFYGSPTRSGGAIGGVTFEF